MKTEILIKKILLFDSFDLSHCGIDAISYTVIPDELIKIATKGKRKRAISIIIPTYVKHHPEKRNIFGMKQEAYSTTEIDYKEFKHKFDEAIFTLFIAN